MLQIAKEVPYKRLHVHCSSFCSSAPDWVCALLQAKVNVTSLVVVTIHPLMQIRDDCIQAFWLFEK